MFHSFNYWLSNKSNGIKIRCCNLPSLNNCARCNHRHSFQTLQTNREHDCWLETTKEEWELMKCYSMKCLRCDQTFDSSVRGQRKVLNPLFFSLLRLRWRVHTDDLLLNCDYKHLSNSCFFIVSHRRFSEPEIDPIWNLLLCFFSYHFLSCLINEADSHDKWLRTSWIRPFAFVSCTACSEMAQGGSGKKN